MGGGELQEEMLTAQHPSRGSAWNDREDMSTSATTKTDSRRGANTCGDGAPTSGLAVRSLNQTSKCALENHSMAAASERQPCEAQPRELDPNRAELSTSDPQLRTLSTHRQVRNTSSTTLRRAEQISVHRDTDDANDDGLRHRGRKWGARTRRASTMGRLH